MAKPVEESLQIILSAKKDVNNLLKGTEHTNNLLEINALFQRLETKFRFIGAVTEPEMNGKPREEMFPPITNFMGEKIEVAKKIDRSELNPKEAEKKQFREDVQSLYDKIRQLSPAQVLNAYTLPEHVLVVRGVAKRAGVEDYENKEMNVQFIEEVQLAIELKADQETQQKGIDTAAGKKQTTEVVLTQDDIDNDPELQKWRAAAGDTLVTRGDGKRSVKKQKQ